jgi:hypothetical protein
MAMGRTDPGALSTAIYALCWRGQAVETCRPAVACLMDNIYTRQREGPTIAFAARRKGGAVKTGTTGMALAALCEFGRTAETDTFDGVMERLANFLLLMQRKDGGFNRRFTPAKGRPVAVEGAGDRRWNQGCRAALGLVLAYRELQDPRFLLAASRALDRLTGEASPEPGDMPRPGTPWLAAAIRHARSALPRDRYRTWLNERAKAVMRAQFGPNSRYGADIAGGCSAVFPPAVGATARQVEVLAAAAAVQKGKNSEASAFMQHARRGARFLLQMQLHSANCYFVKKPDAARGCFLARYGHNVASTSTTTHALLALTATLREM